MLLKNINKTICYDRASQTSDSTNKTIIFKRTSRQKSQKIQKSYSTQETHFKSTYINKVQLLTINNQQQDDKTIQPLNKILKRKNQAFKPQNKRQPTPYKILRQLPHEQKRVGNQININKEMEKHSLQKNLITQKNIREIYQHKSKKFQNQLVIQVKKTKQAEKSLQQFKIKFKQCNDKLEQCNSKLQSFQNSKESIILDLNNTIFQLNNIEIKHLKQKFQNSQKVCQSLRTNINNLSQQNINLKTYINSCKLNNQKININCIAQQKIKLLKQQVEALNIKINADKSQRQKVLQVRLLQIESQLIILRKQNRHYQLQLDFLNRKKHEQFKLLQKRKHQDIKCLRTKYSQLMQEYKKLKSLSEKQTKKLTHQMVQIKTNRTNRFSDKAQFDQFVSFSLTPQPSIQKYKCLYN